MKEYVHRQLVLRRLGFQNYREYLASNLWAKIRAAKLKQHPRCFGCGRPATQVHHAKYTLDVMLGHNQDLLYSACGRCHNHSEFDKNGRKNNPRQATKRLKQIRRQWNGYHSLKIAMYATMPDSVDAQFKERLEREK